MVKLNCNRATVLKLFFVLAMVAFLVPVNSAKANSLHNYSANNSAAVTLAVASSSSGAAKVAVCVHDGADPAEVLDGSSTKVVIEAGHCVLVLGENILVQAAATGARTYGYYYFP